MLRWKRGGYSHGHHSPAARFHPPFLPARPQVIVFVALYSGSDLQLSTNRLRVAPPGQG